MMQKLRNMRVEKQMGRMRRTRRELNRREIRVSGGEP